MLLLGVSARECVGETGFCGIYILLRRAAPEEPERRFRPRLNSQCRYWQGLADSPLWLRILQAEADFHRHLEVCNGAVGQLATDRLHFEPVQAAHGLRRACHPAADSRVNSVG